MYTVLKKTPTDNYSITTGNIMIGIAGIIHVFTDVVMGHVNHTITSDLSARAESGSLLESARIVRK